MKKMPKWEWEVENYEMKKHREYIAKFDAEIAESQRTKSYDELYRELCGLPCVVPSPVYGGVAVKA